MGGWGDGTDDAPRSEVNNRQTEVTAEGHPLEKLDSGDEVATDFQLFDFVIETTDFGFCKLDGAPFLGFGDAHFANDLNGFTASGHSQIAKLFKGSVSGFASCAHFVVDAKATLFGRGGFCFRLQTGEDFPHHFGDECFVNRCHFLFGLLGFIENFFCDIDGIDDSDDDCVDWRCFVLGG